MTKQFHHIVFDCGCELNIRKDGTVQSYLLCEKHFRQRKDAD